jgi:hypothetical protein
MKKQSPQEFFEDYDNYCFHKDPKNNSSLFSKSEYEDYLEFQYYDDMHTAEQEAENAWLRKAEEGIDDGFDRWEWERGCFS